MESHPTAALAAPRRPLLPDRRYPVRPPIATLPLVVAATLLLFLPLGAAPAGAAPGDDVQETAPGEAPAGSGTEEGAEEGAEAGSGEPARAGDPGLPEPARQAAAQMTAEAAAPTLRRLADAIDRPAVGPRVDLGRRIPVGRGTLEPAPSTPVRLLLAGSEPAGLLVDGPATFVYRVEDRFSVPVAQRNLGEGAQLSAKVEDGVLVIREPASSAAVWSWTLGAAAAKTAQEGSAPEGGALPEALQEVLEKILFHHPSNALLMDRGIEGREGMAYALVKGQGETLFLEVDPVVDHQEMLAVVADVSRYNVLQRGLYKRFGIAVQPIGRQWWEREGAREPLVLTHQDVALHNTGGRAVVSTSTSRVTARRGGASIWNTFVGNEFYGDEAFHPLTVEAVTVNGEAADFLHRGHRLMVDLGEPVPAGGSVEVGVVLRGDLAIRPGNDSYWRPAGSWRPRPDLDGEFATFELEVKVPDPQVPLASGTTLERKQADGFHLVRSRIDKPSVFPSVVAGRYHLSSEERNGLTCTTATYVFAKEKPAEILRNMLFAGAELFEQYFGAPYPFTEVNVVEINDWGWGQAPAGTIYITKEAYNPIGDPVSRLYSGGVNARFLHEVAHGWWGHVIKFDSPEEQWLSESFADYAAALAMAARHRGKRGEREFNQMLREWKAHAEDAGEGGSIYLANYLDSRDPTDTDNDDRFRLLYNKGPYVLHALRQELGRQLGSAEQGDRYFQALLRTLVTNFSNGYGETRHLVGILNQMTGRDWQPWFEKYVYGTEMPPVET